MSRFVADTHNKKEVWKISPSLFCDWSKKILLPIAGRNILKIGHH